MDEPQAVDVSDHDGVSRPMRLSDRHTQTCLADLHAVKCRHRLRRFTESDALNTGA